MPQLLKEKLEAIAETDRRSLSSMIVVVLENFVAKGRK